MKYGFVRLVVSCAWCSTLTKYRAVDESSCCAAGGKEEEGVQHVLSLTSLSSARLRTDEGSRKNVTRYCCGTLGWASG
jgi:hypothetical protein